MSGWSRGPPGSAGVRFEFRRFDEAPWSTVPNARLTTDAGSVATLPISAGAGGVTPVLIWDTLATTETDPGVGDNQLPYQVGPIAVRAVNATTGKASDARLVILDRTPPELNIKSNRGDSPLLVGDTVRFRWKPAEPVAGYNLVTDDERDTDSPAEITTPASTGSATITHSSAGNRDVRLRAVDAAGNWTPIYALEGQFVDGLVTGPPPALILDGSERPPTSPSMGNQSLPGRSRSPKAASRRSTGTTGTPHPRSATTPAASKSAPPPAPPPPPATATRQPNSPPATSSTSHGPDSGRSDPMIAGPGETPHPRQQAQTRMNPWTETGKPSA